MSLLRYTLLSDGSSDRALLPILNWLLVENFPHLPFIGEWADSSRLPPIAAKLPNRIQAAVDLYPCDILFVHRDAERFSYDERRSEILAAIEGLTNLPLYICVIPVRMQEAWLLFDERAIRQAAGNPNGKMTLTLPAIASVENLPDPKQILHEALRQASGLSGRRLKRFNPHKHVHLVAENIPDFESLRKLSAFVQLEMDVQGLTL